MSAYITEAEETLLGVPIISGSVYKLGGHAVYKLEHHHDSRHVVIPLTRTRRPGVKRAAQQ